MAVGKSGVGSIAVSFKFPSTYKLYKLLPSLVIVIYNPKSKKRDWQLEKAQQIVLKYRGGKTPVGIVTSAMREKQNVRIVPLEELHKAPVNMQTTVFIGSSASSAYLDYMVTPRGYTKKYSIGADKP